MVVVTPVLPHPAASIADTPTSELIFIATERSHPITGESFGTWFGRGPDTTPWPQQDRGASCGRGQRGAAHTLFGWANASGESATDTRSANSERLAREAKINPAPVSRVRDENLKAI